VSNYFKAGVSNSAEYHLGAMLIFMYYKRVSVIVSMDKSSTSGLLSAEYHMGVVLIFMHDKRVSVIVSMNPY